MTNSAAHWQTVARTLMDANPAAGMVLLDANGLVREANRQGRDLAALLDLSAHESPAPESPLGPALDRLRADPATRWLRGITTHRVVAEVGAIRAADGSFEGAVVLLRDVEAGTSLSIGAGSELSFDHWGTYSDGLFEWHVGSGAVAFFPGWQRLVRDTAAVADTFEGWMARVEAADRAAVRGAIEDHLAGRTPTFRIEYRLQHREGGLRWIRGIGQVVERNPSGHPLRVAGYAIDITAWRGLEQSLREQTAMMREAQRLAQLGSWMLDGDTGSVSWSPELFRIAGLPQGEVPPFAEHDRLMTAESIARIRTLIRDAIERGLPYETEIDMVRPSGELRRVRVHGEALRDSDGRVRRVWGVAQDITAQLGRERMLAQQSALLARMSAIASIGAWSYEIASNRLSWSDETYNIHELEPGTEITVEKAISYYSGESRSIIGAAVREAIEHGNGFDLELTLRTARGRDIWVRSQGQTEYEDGKAVCVTGTFQDISQRKLAEQRLDEALASLRAANTELRQFAFVASHDLQEPLRKVQTFGSLIAERSTSTLDPEARDYLERMIGAAARMSALVDDLLALSRVDSAERRLEHVDLAVLMRELAADFDLELSRSEGRIEIGPLPCIEADRAQATQLFRNLIGNAIKYRASGRPPVVRISTAEAPPASACVIGAGWVRVEISDNGIGFDNRYARTIFEPFRRLHDRSQYTGTGMGLAIVRRIVERHSGRIAADGRPGEGACFIVDLPSRQPADSGSDDGTE
jgi:PAS domain S-box-containing protein